MSAATSPTSASTLRSLRLMSGAIISAVVVLAVVVCVTPGFETPPAWMYAVGPVLAAVGFGLATLLGYRVTAAEPGLDPQQQALRSQTDFRIGHMLRIALTEAPAILTLVLCYVAQPPTALPYLVGLPFFLASLWWHVWPSDALISRVAQRIERSGAPSYLREGLQRPATIGSSLPHL